MANKFVTGFVLVCIVLVAATTCVQQAQADDGRFKSCFENCEKECLDGGQGSTFCEMKCDADCGAKEAAAKLNINI
ncbi:hypothetical protein DITRI_Ditri11bG0090400 [Diplodiscus trichospermus]